MLILHFLTRSVLFSIYRDKQVWHLDLSDGCDAILGLEVETVSV